MSEEFQNMYKIGIDNLATIILATGVYQFLNEGHNSITVILIGVLVYMLRYRLDDLVYLASRLRKNLRGG